MYVAHSHSRDGAMSYFSLLQILTLENIYKFKLALFIHKIKSDPINIPVIFSGTLTLASEIHSYNTSICSNYGATIFSFAASKIWETIPLELKNIYTNCIF